MSNHRRYLITIFILAFVIRMLGIWHGYPYSFYPDEAHFVKRALSFGSLDFNPHWFHKPAFYMYVLFFEYGLFFAIGKAINFWTSVTEFAVAYILNPGPFYIIGRISTAFFGLSTIWIVYLIGDRYFRTHAGVLGALLLTLSYGHVAACQDIKADIPAAFFAILSLYYLLKYEADAAKRYLLMSAGIAGIGAATKVYPIVMLVPIFTVILLAAWSKHKQFIKKFRVGLIWCCIALIVFWAAYFVAAPYSFIDPLGQEATFGRILHLYYKIVHISHTQPIANVANADPANFINQRTGIGQGFISYLSALLNNNGMGLLIGSIGIAGIGLLLCKANRRSFILLLFPILFTILSVYSNPGYAKARHQLPLYPFLAVTGGVFIVWLADINRSWKKHVYGTLLLFLCLPLFLIFQRAIHVSKTDTRNIAKQWIEKSIPAGSKILIDENGPQLLTSEQALKNSIAKAEKADSKGQFTAHYDMYLNFQLLAAQKAITYDITEIRLPWWREAEVQQGTQELSSEYDRDMANPLRPVGVNTYKYYLDSGYQYVVVQSDRYQTFIKTNSKAARNFPSFGQFYSELFQKGKLIKEFSPEDGNRPGPVVKIFQLGNSNSIMPENS